MTQFNELGFAAPILKALEGEGYTTPTPIQAQAIPAAIAGSDILGIAQTGTGKTAAFALPILHRLATNRTPTPRKGCRALILSPTRELASQIGQSFKTYGRHLGLTVGIVFGGIPHGPQIRTLAKGVDILIATPGRLLDHIADRKVQLSGTEILVLDEADQMLDAGFLKPIQRIISNLSARRQSLLFSATMPKEIAHLADNLLREPVKVSVTPTATTVDRIAQRIIFIEAKKKKALLVELFADEAMSHTLVFTRTKRGADRVARHLTACGIDTAAIHGNKSQRQREIALNAFREAKIRVLVATDIAARGIDVDGVSHVVNYEMPEVPEAYVHRIGRTARAGASGSAISLCDNEERDLLRSIERLIRQTIPTVDRRNDSTLTAEAKGAGRESRPRTNPHKSQRAAGANKAPGKTSRSYGEGKRRRPERKAEHAPDQHQRNDEAGGDQQKIAQAKPDFRAAPRKQPRPKARRPKPQDGTARPARKPNRNRTARPVSA
ncbi:MAG: DEAD/DEAH box helicase [Filomicrobium sp.]